MGSIVTTKSPFFETEHFAVDALVRALHEPIVEGAYDRVITLDAASEAAYLVAASTERHAGEGALPPEAIPLGIPPEAGSAEIRAAIGGRKADIAALAGSRRVLVIADSFDTGLALEKVASTLAAKGVSFDVSLLHRYHSKMKGPAMAPLEWRQRFVEELAMLGDSQILTDAQASSLVNALENGTFHMRDLRRLQAHIAAGTLTDDMIQRFSTLDRRTRKATKEEIETLERYIDRSHFVHRTLPGEARELFAGKLLSRDIPREIFLECSAMLFETGFEPGKRYVEAIEESLRTAPDPAIDAHGWPEGTTLIDKPFNLRPVRRSEAAVARAILAGGTKRPESFDPSSPEVRDDAEMLGEWYAACRGFSSKKAEGILSAMFTLLHKIAPAVRADEFGIIVGDDTSGRIPTLIVAKAVNAYRLKHGLPKLPVMFVEGVRRSGRIDVAKARDKAYEKRSALIGSADPSKKALVVTDNVASGESVESIIVKLREHGIESDVAAFGGASGSDIQSIYDNGVWKRSTRHYSGEGDTDLLIDNTSLSGLSQRRPKFGPTLVVKKRGARKTAHQIRQDIQQVTPVLERQLE